MVRTAGRCGFQPATQLYLFFLHNTCIQQRCSASHEIRNTECPSGLTEGEGSESAPQGSLSHVWSGAMGTGAQRYPDNEHQLTDEHRVPRGITQEHEVSPPFRICTQAPSPMSHSFSVRTVGLYSSYSRNRCRDQGSHVRTSFDRLS